MAKGYEFVMGYGPRDNFIVAASYNGVQFASETVEDRNDLEKVQEALTKIRYAEQQHERNNKDFK